MHKFPLIAVVGATGTGKSKLAVEIAKRVGGEIINGDSLQLYEGLEITTNKITEDEQQGVTHHLLGCVPLHERPWAVNRFVASALTTIDGIRSRGRVPILVGGTHYYTQSLLFRDALAETNREAQEESLTDDLSIRWPILNAPVEDMLAELRRVDPLMADRWHPSDGRKIKRSLEIYLQTGRRASDVYADQRRSRSNTASSRLRFRTLVFWVHCAPETLRPRLDKRVSWMLAAGLLDEVKTLAALQAEQVAAGQVVDTSSGVYIAIGYKELLPYLTSLEAAVSPDEADKTQRVQLALEGGIERTKIATRQYAKRQVHWIRSKLCRELLTESDAHMYLLDATALDAWDEQVSTPSQEIVSRFLAEEALPDPASLSASAAREMKVVSFSEQQTYKRQICETCGTVAVTKSEWEQHVTSRRHISRLAKERRNQAAGEEGQGHST